MQVHVAQHDADRTALWGSLLVWIDLAVFQGCLPSTSAGSGWSARIADAVLHKAWWAPRSGRPPNEQGKKHPFVTETPKEILQVRLQHPAHLAAGDYLVEGCQGVVGPPFRPSAK